VEQSDRVVSKDELMNLVWTDITLRSVRSMRPDKALQLPIAGRGFMGQRRPTSLPSPGRLWRWPLLG
jgi:hypothetical protein